MKKIVLPLFFALFCVFSLKAQNNPYEIDDECYSYYCKAEELLGKPGFLEINDALLRTAIAKDDTKSQTLYYVERLKDLTFRYRKVESSKEIDAKVEMYANELRDVALNLGYKQYYYFAYELQQNHYHNHGMTVRTMELVKEMQEYATTHNDVYGQWMGYRYMIALYIDQGDYITAKKYIFKALEIYENTDDPVVKRQSICRLYCDLSDTYVIGSDSVRVNVGKAIKSAKVHMDTLRCEYHLAKIAAYDKDLDAYYRHRDYCISDPMLGTISRTAAKLFATLDSIIGGTFDYDTVKDLAFSRVREVKYIANVAEVYGYKDQAFEIERLLVWKFEDLFADSNQSKLTELDARLGNYRLNADLREKEAEVNRILSRVTLLISALLLGIMIFLIFHIGTLRRNNRKLREANERVMLADAAKTRFVQNMSHEVRTPLNAIVGFSQLLSLPDGSFSEEEKDEFAGHIVNNTKMLTMLLDDILNTSAMDSGNYRISYEEGECSFMCNAAISSAEHRLQPGVRMYYEPQFEGSFTFRTDPRRVQQIIINLLTNACKHTTKGEIKLACSLEENPGEVTFSVTDTGPGVPADQAEKIFERFTKLNEFVQGTGLGLSICRDIASKMGGRVWLDTTYTGGGARFVFTVPVNPPEQTA